MQTFLPYSSFEKSAFCLDKKRCWKQVVEAKQIINTLEGLSKGWRNHPATKMWVGHIPALKLYFNIFLGVCKVKHKINTHLEIYHVDNLVSLPSWIGNEEFHKSHQSNLLRKNFTYYSKFNWSVPDNLPYFWPSGLDS